MKVKWKKNKNLKPDVILQKIDAIKFFSDDGRLHYSGLEYDNAMAALYSMVDFPEKIMGIDEEYLISKAVDNIAKDQLLNSDKIIEEINSLLESTLAKKPVKYHLLTSISLDKPYPARNIEMEDCRIRIIENSYPAKYTGRNDLIKKYKIKLEEVPEDYTKVIVDLKSKSSWEAIRKALRILDIQRAIWCLLGNSAGEIWGKGWVPINRVRLGGVHTIHEDDGKVVTDTILYEPNFLKTKLYNPDNPKTYREGSAWFIKQLNMSKYGYRIKEALLRFVRAFDERDHNVALIRLWGALESLASPSNANYDLVTRRCAFLFKEYDYHKQILEHLRECRNSNIHAGSENRKAKTNCYQLQTYFRELVIFHLRHAEYFPTLEKANNFLDFNNDVNSLENKRKLIEKAIQFRTGSL